VDASDALVVIVQVAAGISLAASAGLRAFLPLFVVGVAQRFGIPNLILGESFRIGPAFEWLASDAALLVLGVAVVAELLADKVPVVDHLLDIVGGLLKPLAGTVVAAAALSSLDSPWTALAGGVVVGGVPAGMVHAAKAKIRLLSSTTTAGFGNPVISFLEDILSLAGTLTAVLFSLLAVLIVGVGAFLTARAFRTFRARRARIARDVGRGRSS
jgi:hypothetical protein